ncbi:MAG: hypothetical protein O4807_03870 [Trichodesmium sp. St19_bin2]|nr:hypothetical protein [Trichodesmium sp. St19_bin2]
MIKWIKDAGIKLPDTSEEQEIPKITEIYELGIFKAIINKKLGFRK